MPTNPTNPCAFHPLDLAYAALVSIGKTSVYVTCGWQSCQRRRRVDPDLWERELVRRQRLPQEAPLTLSAQED
jgi:hypothetical protein